MKTFFSLLKRLIVILITTLCTCNILFAQDIAALKPKRNKLFGNSFQLVTGNYYIKNTPHALGASPFAQMGVYFNRRVYENIGIGIGYSEWNRNKIWINTGHHMLQEFPTDSYIPIVGKIEYRWDYKMVDGYAYYQHALFDAQHYIHAEIGISYCWGRNEYLDSYWENPWGGDILATYHIERAFYWGIIPSIGYNYFFLKKRLNAGLFVRGRYYEYRNPMQLDIALNIGVNFG